jgi:hypothetical protein
MAIQLTARETNSIPKELHFSTNKGKSGLTTQNTRHPDWCVIDVNIPGTADSHFQPSSIAGP